MPTPAGRGRSVARALWTYQRERFPLARNGPLIFAFALSAVCISALLRGEREFPEPATHVTAFVVLLCVFLQLRIADEFKDAELDARTRPELPVPRGLVSLREIAWVGAALVAVEVVAVALHDPRLLVFLAVVGAYMGLMAKEFFVRDWLRRRPFAYMATHMLIMPLVDLFATACDWFVVGDEVPDGLFWFLAVSLFNGVIIEVGRKTWSADREREGVETYSSAWGAPVALGVWLSSVALALACSMAVARDIGFVGLVAAILGALAAAMAFTAWRFLRTPTARASRALEDMSGAWVFGVYLALGIIPMLMLELA